MGCVSPSAYRLAGLALLLGQVGFLWAMLYRVATPSNQYVSSLLADYWWYALVLSVFLAFEFGLVLGFLYQQRAAHGRECAWGAAFVGVTVLGWCLVVSHDVHHEERWTGHASGVVLFMLGSLLYFAILLVLDGELSTSAQRKHHETRQHLFCFCCVLIPVLLLALASSMIFVYVYEWGMPARLSPDDLNQAWMYEHFAFSMQALFVFIFFYIHHPWPWWRASGEPASDEKRPLVAMYI